MKLVRRGAITSLCMLVISCTAGHSVTSTGSPVVEQKSVNQIPSAPKLPYAEVTRCDVPPKSANARFIVTGDEFNELRARLPKPGVMKRGKVKGVSGWDPRAIVVFHEMANQSQDIEISWTYFAGLDSDAEFGLDPSFQSYFEGLQKAHAIPSGGQ
jgi:hypothetical protein